MSGSVSPNPFFTNPAFGRGLGNLALIFAPNPQREMLRSRADLYLERAGTERLRQEQLREQIAGGRDLSAAFMEGLGEDPANAWRRIFGAAARGGPQTLRVIPGVAGVFAATQGVPEVELGRIVVGAGGDWRRTESGTRFVEGEETRRAFGVTDRQVAGAIARERIQSGDRRYATDQQAATARDVERMREEGRNQRWAQVLRPGEVAILPPNSPGAPPGATEPVRVQGDPRPQTFDQARAAEVGPYIRGEGTPEEQDRRRAIVAPSVSAAEVRAQHAAQQAESRAESAARAVEVRAQALVDAAVARGESAERVAQIRADGAAEAARIRAEGQMEAARLRAEGQVAAARERPVSAGRPVAVNAAVARAIGDQIDAQSVDADGPFRLEPQARQWIGRRAAQLYQSGDEGVRLNAPEAVAQAMAEFFAANPPRTDTRMNPMSSRWFGLPPALRDGVSSGGAAAQPAAREGRDVVLPGGRVIREGTVVVQNGQRYVARGGRMVPVDARSQPARDARPGA